jgi:hypothetical protein
MRQGLMQPPQAQQQPQQPQPQAAPGQPPTGDMDEGASEQEQQQYDDLMGSAFGLIHGKEYRDKTVARLKQGKDIGKTIGEMALAIFNALEGQVVDAGSEIPDAVRMEAGEDIIMELVQVAVAAQLMPDDDATLDKVIASAMTVAIGQYADQAKNEGRVDPKGLQESALKLNGLTKGIQQAQAQPQPQQQGAI